MIGRHTRAMVSQNDSHRRPNNPGKPTPGGLPPEGLTEAELALGQELVAQLRQAAELGRDGHLGGAAEVSRKAIRASEATGGIHEASVILAFLPALFPSARPDEALKLAHRAAALTTNLLGCDHLTSRA